MTTGERSHRAGPGVVRAVTPDGERHCYGVGAAPAGEFVGELGALFPAPGRDRVPVCLSADGRLLTAEPGLTTRPSRMQLARWALAPLRWSLAGGESPGWDLVAWRLRYLHSHRRPAGALSSVPIVGYLAGEPAPSLLPLFEGIHPVTGDQLLTHNRWEVTDLGYVGCRLLGYLEPRAPVSGSLLMRRPSLPWASRLGQRFREERAPSVCLPQAQVDEPADGVMVSRLPVRISGWALFAGEAVGRVELTVNGRPAGRARLGCPRPDLAALCRSPEAPIGGWEAWLGAAELPEIAPRLRLGGTVHGSAGSVMPLPSVDIVIGEGMGSIARSVPSPRAGPSPAPPGRFAGEPSPGSDLFRASGPRVLVVTHSLDRGGAQLYLAELIERLASEGMAFTVVAPSDGPLRERMERAGAAVHLSPAPAPWTREAYDGRVAELASWIARGGFSLAVINTLTCFWAADAAARAGLPTVFTVHESYDPLRYWAEFLHPHDPAVLARLESAIDRVSAIVFEAEATRRLFDGYADPDRLITLPYGIDLPAIARFRDAVDQKAARQALSLSTEATVVVCMGTIERRKQQASLSRAFTRVCDRHPGALLALVGQVDSGWSEPSHLALSDFLVRSGQLHRLRVAPMGEDPFLWHQAADLLICASDNESLPRVILEAMAFERPVVSTDVFGVPEVIEDGVTGYLCRTRDEEELARALDRALSGLSTHCHVIAAAKDRVSRLHDQDRYARTFKDLLVSLTERDETGDFTAMRSATGSGSSLPGEPADRTSPEHAVSR